MTENALHALLAGWREHQNSPRPATGQLPPHHPHCLGCGQENPHGHHLIALQDGNDAVISTHTFDVRHVGAPGIAHGGAVATVLDDLYGFLLYAVGSLAVTRKLEIEYIRPVLLNVEYTLRASVVDRTGRKLWMKATLDDGNGTPSALSNALFIAVDPEHFQVSANH